MGALAAKQFLVSKVIEQAEVEHMPLSDVEKKVLEFTELHPSLPDIHEVNEQFERGYDSDEYEAKVAGLLKNARARDGRQSADREQQWTDVLEALRKEDHYILVMTAQAFGSGSVSGSGNRSGKLLIYIAIGIAMALIFIFEGLLKH